MILSGLKLSGLGDSSSVVVSGAGYRSDQLAHAYLFYPDATELTPEARARPEVMQFCDWVLAQARDTRLAVGEGEPA